MSNGYEMAAGGVNNFLSFYSGFLEGRALRKEKEYQQEIRNLIKTAIQQGTMQPSYSYSIGPRGQVTTRIAPSRTTQMTPYQQATLAEKERRGTEERGMRSIYGLDLPTEEQLASFPAQGGYPTVESGYAVPSEAGGEYLLGYEPMPREQMFEREVAAPTRERYEKAGYRPKIAGFEKVEKKEIGFKTETEKKSSKAELFKQYTNILSPNLNINAFVTKYGGKEAPTIILKRLRKSKEDFIAWIETTYGKNISKQLFPEVYLKSIQ